MATISSLPIEDLRAPLSAALATGESAFLIHAPTGSGKSTQIPQMLVDAGIMGDIVVLQPRRIAARMLAKRVAWERGVSLGDEVGYQVRFEKMVGPKTRIRFVTEGILLRQMLQNPTLRGVGAVVFDEFHERHLDADVGLARCRRLQEETRPDLKLLVMSATLSLEGLESYLAPCETLSSSGRTYPVDIRYRPQGGRDLPVWDKVVRAARELLSEDKDGGHTLVFLPGGFEIRKTIEALGREKWARDFDLLPLHGELSPNQQDAAVEPGKRRKIIVATNVAETSLTIDGVRLVIDSGLARMPNYDATRGINTLTIESISQASADQRAGRAGRTAPGVCVRLWGEAQHFQRATHEVPEIHRLDLAEMVLALKAGGIDDLAGFPWFEEPETATLERAHQLLRDLDAIDRQTGQISELGRRMTAFPVPPRYARILVEAESSETSWLDACLLVALAQGRPLFPKGKTGDSARQRFAAPNDPSDFLPLMRAFQTAANARFDLGVCQSHGIHAGAAREAAGLVQLLDRLSDPEARVVGAPLSLVDLALVGFPDHVAVRRTPSSKVFDVSGGRAGQLGLDSVIETKTRLVAAAEIAEIEGKDINVILGLATAVTEEDLRRHFPNDFHEEQGAFYNAVERRVVAEKRLRFRDLVLECRQAGEPPKDEAALMLADRVMSGELVLKNWNHAVISWLARMNCLRLAMPELEVPEFTEEDRRLVLTEICSGAVTYKQIKDRAVLPTVRDWLGKPLQAAVESYTPEQITLSNGTRAKVDYVTNAEPSISVVLQRLYDVRETPKIVDGRVPLVVYILAPNQRPAQTTRDLAGFWENSYPAVRAQLKGRYPKHEWR